MPSASPPSLSSQKATSRAKRRLARDPLLDRAPLMRAQHAEHVFGGVGGPDRLRLWSPIAHRSRHSLSFGKAAPDPALHRAERHALPLRQFLIGAAIHEGRADGRGLALPRARPDRSSSRSCSCVGLQHARKRAAQDRATRSAASIGSMRRRGRAPRSRSMARLRAIATSQVIGLARSAIERGRPSAKPSCKRPAARPPPRCGHSIYGGRRQKASPRYLDRLCAARRGRRTQRARARRQAAYAFRLHPSWCPAEARAWRRRVAIVHTRGATVTHYMDYTGLAGAQMHDAQALSRLASQDDVDKISGSRPFCCLCSPARTGQAGAQHPRRSSG